MQSSTSPTRTTTTAEPSSALKALIDLPLRFKVPESFVPRIDTLTNAAFQAKSREDYVAVYRTAVEIVDALVRELDTTIEQMQRDALRQDDPNELRNRLAAAPRKEAEKARGDARNALQKVHKEWVDRTRRQLEHVMAQCLEAAQKLELTEVTTPEGLSLRVDARWWKDFGGYVSKCCEEWTRNVVDKADDAYRSAVAAATSPALHHASRKNVTTPDASSGPPPDAKLATETPVKDVEIPTTLSALMQSVRSNIMAVGIFGTVLAVLVTLAGKIMGESSGASSYTMLARGGLILVILPFSVVFGLKGAKKQRASMRDKALAAQRLAVTAFVKAELERSLERHRKGLERWLSGRGEAWTNALDRWWDTSVEPRLAEYDAKAADAVRDARLAQAKSSEDLAAVRTFRSQLAQNLLFELRRRHRELEATPT